MLDQGYGREASPGWVRGQFLAERERCEQVKRKDWDGNKQLFDKIFLQCQTQQI